jgi:exopolysaccharide biosynthesis operon protein EpsL
MPRSKNKKVPPRFIGFRAPSVTCIAFLSLLVPIDRAAAFEDGRLTLSAEETVAWDSNVFRIPSGAMLGPAGTSLPRNDTYYATRAGFAFNLPVSRQRFTGGIIWNDTRYERYSELDFTGHDGNVTWLWEIGNDALGKLGYRDIAAPQTFAGVQGRSANVLRTKREFVNGAFFVVPHWRIDAGASGLQQTNSSAPLRFENLNIVAGEATLNYVSPARDVLGARARVEDGHYPDHEFDVGGAFPHAYRQYGTGVVFDWKVTGKSQLTGWAEYANRNWDQFSQADWSGFLGHIRYDWKPTDKFTLNAILRREIDPFDDMKWQFALVRSAILIPSWNATAKIDVTALLDYSARDYLGISQFACGLAPARSDRIKSGTVTVAWRLLDVATLNFSAQHQNCWSDIPTANYSTTIYRLGVKVAL